MIARVSFEIKPPIGGITKEQFIEWIKFALQEAHEINGKNPLCNYDLDLQSNGECLEIDLNVQ